MIQKDYCSGHKVSVERSQCLLSSKPTAPWLEVSITFSIRFSSFLTNETDNEDTLVFIYSVDRFRSNVLGSHRQHTTPWIISSRKSCDVIFACPLKSCLVSGIEGEPSKLKEGDKSAETLLNEAVETIRSSSTTNNECDVTIAEDFMELLVPRQKSVK